MAWPGRARRAPAWRGTAQARFRSARQGAAEFGPARRGAGDGGWSRACLAVFRCPPAAWEISGTGRAWPDSERPGQARQGMVGQGMARPGRARPGAAWPGAGDGLGLGSRTPALDRLRVVRGMDRRGCARCGWPRLGAARRGSGRMVFGAVRLRAVYSTRQGKARQRWARPGGAGRGPTCGRMDTSRSSTLRRPLFWARQGEVVPSKAVLGGARHGSLLLSGVPHVRSQGRSG